MQQGEYLPMKNLLHYLLLFHFLMLHSCESVTVQPSSSRFPYSFQVTWPKSSKVTITVQCPSHFARILLYLPDESLKGTMILKFGVISIWCKDAGSMDFYGGEKREYAVESSGPCTDDTVPSETVIIEWTQTGVKVVRNEELIVSREWGATDGSCLKKTGYWKIQNRGSTVISGENVQGIRF